MIFGADRDQTGRLIADIAVYICVDEILSRGHPPGQRVPEGTDRVRDEEAHVGEERAVEPREVLREPVPLLRAHLGAALEVADLSPRGGGASRWHRTHRHGEDVDLLLFATDAAGRPARAGKAMVAFDCAGQGAPTDEAGNPVPPLMASVTLMVIGPSAGSLRANSVGNARNCTPLSSGNRTCQLCSTEPLKSASTLACVASSVT